MDLHQQKTSLRLVDASISEVKRVIDPRDEKLYSALAVASDQIAVALRIVEMRINAEPENVIITCGKSAAAGPDL